MSLCTKVSGIISSITGTHKFPRSGNVEGRNESHFATQRHRLRKLRGKNVVISNPWHPTKATDGVVTVLTRQHTPPTSIDDVAFMPQRYSLGTLHITNGRPSPDNSTNSSSASRRLASTSSSAQDSQVLAAQQPLNAPYVHPLGSNPSGSLRNIDTEIQENAEAPVVQGLTRGGHSSVAGIVPHHDDVASVPPVSLQEAIVSINPLTQEDVPIDGRPTIYGDGSRYHDYSRPDTFTIAKHPSGQPLENPRIGKQSSQNSSNLHVPISAHSQPTADESADWPPPPSRFNDYGNPKRQGRVFHISELPSPLRAGHISRYTPMTPHSARDEEDLHLIPRSQVTQYSTSTSFQRHTKPEVQQLGETINASINRRRARQARRESESGSLTIPPRPQRASNTSSFVTSAANPASGADNEIRTLRNGTSTLVAMPGRYSTSQLPLPTSSTTHGPGSLPIASESIRASVMTFATDSTGSKSLKHMIAEVLHEYESSHPRLAEKIRDSVSSSTYSLFVTMKDIVGVPYHAEEVSTMARQPSPDSLRTSAELAHRYATRTYGAETLSKRSSASSIDMLRGVGREIMREWRKKFYKGKVDSNLMNTVLSDAIQPAMEKLEVDFLKWRI